jgi:predicted amidohydrolase
MRHQILAVALVAFAAAAATMLADDAAPAPQGKPAPPRARDATPPAALRVAAVQMRSTRDLAENVARIRRHLERCKADGVRVAVFPECALTGYFDADYFRQLDAGRLADAEGQVRAACRELDLYAVVGTPTRGDGDTLFNSAVVIDPAGRIIERYHKLQLAEDWPQEGDHLSVFRVDGVPCSIIICHDERYPELVRLPVLAGARVIFYISFESDLRNEHKLGPYRAQIQARAVENGVYVVHANAPANEDLTGSHGQSRVVAPDGRIVQEASMFDEEAVAATLDLTKATGAWARNSVERGPLRDWWAQGVKQVRMID